MQMFLLAFLCTVLVETGSCIDRHAFEYAEKCIIALIHDYLVHFTISSGDLRPLALEVLNRHDGPAEVSFGRSQTVS